MRLSDYRKTFYEFSGKASDGARTLAFAGIAVVWIFKTQTSPVPKLPDPLLLPSGLLVLCLAFDLLQYVSATCVWGLFQWWQERKLEDLSADPELDAPTYLKWPQFAFFLLKLASLLLAYVLLTRVLFSLWFGSKGV